MLPCLAITTGFFKLAPCVRMVVTCFNLKNQLNLLRPPYALNLKDFPEHFDFTRRVTMNKAIITCKTLNLQHLSRSRYDSTDYFRFNHAGF